MNVLSKRCYGISLFEVVFALVLIAVLIAAISLVFIVGLRAWYDVGRGADIRTEAHFGLERIMRDVRQANGVTTANHALRFTRHETDGDQSYIYYLYNASENWIPPYEESVYELRRASLSGGIDGSFTYGAGDLMVKNLKPPPDGTTITSEGNSALIVLDLVSGDSEWKVRGYVCPRNIV